MWNKECVLGRYQTVRNEAGEPVKKIVFTEEPVYCNKKSIRMSEFYQAQTTRFRPEITLEIRKADIDEYLGEDGSSADMFNKLFIQYEGNEYSVIRIYEPSEDTVEVVLQRGISDERT